MPKFKDCPLCEEKDCLVRIEKKEIITYKSEDIEVAYKMYLCTKCGGEFYGPGDDPLKEVYRLYAERHPQPKEDKE